MRVPKLDKLLELLYYANIIIDGINGKNKAVERRRLRQRVLYFDGLCDTMWIPAREVYYDNYQDGFYVKLTKIPWKYFIIFHPDN